MSQGRWRGGQAGMSPPMCLRVYAISVLAFQLAGSDGLRILHADDLTKGGTRRPPNR